MVTTKDLLDNPSQMVGGKLRFKLPFIDLDKPDTVYTFVVTKAWVDETDGLCCDAVGENGSVHVIKLKTEDGEVL